jgi:hypothetical protein
VAVLLAEFPDVVAGGLEDAEPQQSEHGDEREVAEVRRVFGCGEQRSNWRWVSPSVGDSAGTFGRLTYSAGECSSTASITQVR